MTYESRALLPECHISEGEGVAIPNASAERFIETSSATFLPMPFRRQQSRKTTPRLVQIDLPPVLAARLGVLCRIVKISPEEFIIDVLEDALGGAVDSPNETAIARASGEVA
jgi:hypothetical protein